MVRSRSRRVVALAPIVALLLGSAALIGTASAQVTKLKVGWCARTVSAAAAPFAIAAKLGWLKQEGIDVELVPMPGSTDCVKNVAVKEVDFSLPSVEPLAVGRPQGIKAQIFYTAYQGNIYGIAVPQDSPVKEFADLRGKRVGVISMGSGGVLVARELARFNGLNPDSDIDIVVAGEGAQTAAMVRGGQVDALSQFDTQYAMVENAGVKLRLLDTRAIDRFPSNGFLALEDTLRTRRKEAVALARSYAKGTVFAIANLLYPSADADPGFTIIFGAIIGAFVFVGALLATRVPANPIGRVILGSGALLATTVARRRSIGPKCRPTPTSC